MLGPKDPLSKLVFELSKLPGIGEKTAMRLAYFIIREPNAYVKSLSEAIVLAKTLTSICKECFHFSDQELCSVCSDHHRDKQIICVVEKPSDVTSIENTSGFKGLYHVLHGVISPLSGVGPDDLKIRELLERISKLSLREIILATNPSVEGDATALYLSKLIKPFGIRITKLAHGIPAGGQLEYSDRLTISKAIENRLEVHTQ